MLFNRFGDDLIELILSYLSLEDKCRLECVSKQFKRCVYNRHSELTIDQTVSQKLQTINICNKPVLDLKSFAIILSKCQSIKAINYYPKNSRQELINLLNISTESLLRFEEIYIDFAKLSPEVIHNFFIKFGPNLKRITNNYGIYYIKPYLSLCPKLSEMSVYRITDLFIENQILVKNLKSISFKELDGSDHKFDIFIDNNRSLEKLEIICCVITEDSVNKVLKQISKLSDLKELKLQFFQTYNKSLSEDLIEMGLKCVNLKRISLFAYCNLMSNQMEIFKAIKDFKSLKRIDLRLSTERDILTQNYPKELDDFLSNSLMNWKNVTHLALHLNKVCDSLFEDLNQYLPKLQSIDILDSNLTFKTTECLAKLPKLQTFKLKTHSNTCITKADIKYLIRNCPKIQWIEISDESKDKQIINCDEIKNQFK